MAKVIHLESEDSPSGHKCGHGPVVLSPNGDRALCCRKTKRSVTCKKCLAPPPKVKKVVKTTARQFAKQNGVSDFVFESLKIKILGELAGRQ